MKKFSLEWWASLKPEVAGKETEKLVEAVFGGMNASQKFAWHRMPDAKAARGALKAQPADYLWRHGVNSGFLEVKALKHDYRLPAGRLSQLPTLHKWSLAGSQDLVLVHHYTIGMWRIVPAAALEIGPPSYDLRDVKTYPTAYAAICSTGLFGE